MAITPSISQPYTAAGYTSGYGITTGSRVDSGGGAVQGYGDSRKSTQEASSQAEKTAPDGSRLTPEDLKLIEELKTADQEVRQHELAHLAAGGSLVTSGAQYTYKTGPDGQQYAVAGEVGIDASAVPGDPQATIEKMQQIKRAAMAPATPSAQDLRVAAKATATAAEAAGELTMLMAKQQASQDSTRALGQASRAADTYQKVSTLPQDDTHSFQIAV